MKKTGKKISWQKWAAMAACLCIVAVGALTLPTLFDSNTPPTSPIQNELAYSFTMGNSETQYDEISFAQRKHFGLVDENATGLTEENTYQITPDDLGTIMGTVGDCADEKMIGATVYHYAAFPDDTAICIVEYNGKYQFYVDRNFTDFDDRNYLDNNMDIPVDEDAEIEGKQPEENPSNDFIEEQHDETAKVSTKEVDDTDITLEYVTELQNKVSNAMINDELPFVVSSAVYENPYRLHVTVTSNAESDLQKLKAFDKLGALEIEYTSENVNILE